MENKSVIFKPYGEKSTIVIKGTLTGKVYQVGEHSHHKKHKVIEVLDEDGRINDAFEDELKSDVKLEEERSYSEEEVKTLIDIINWYDNYSDVRPNFIIPEIKKDIILFNWFTNFEKQFKKK